MRPRGAAPEITGCHGTALCELDRRLLEEATLSTGQHSSFSWKSSQKLCRKFSVGFAKPGRPTGSPKGLFHTTGSTLGELFNAQDVHGLDVNHRGKVRQVALGKMG